MKINPYILLLFVSLLLFSCMDDEQLWNNLPSPKVKNPYSGIFIVNEGNFMYGNASLSYYDIKNKQVFNDIFYNTNALPLGDVAFSAQLKDSLLYVVVNNSGKIYIIDANNFQLVDKITGFTSPRNILFIDETKAYVSDLYSKKIAVVNLQTNKIQGYIDVDNHNNQFMQHSTEQMIRYKNFVFVNCWSFDNKILKIDILTDKLVDSIEVIKQPNSMVIDKYNKLWVLSDGGFAGSYYGQETPGLTCINPETFEIEKVITFEKNDNPTDLCINGTKDTLFYINKHVYFMPVEQNICQIFTESQASTNMGGFYSLSVDSVNSDVYLGDAKSFTQNGEIYRYKSDKTPIDTFVVGIIPGDFCFKK